MEKLKLLYSLLSGYLFVVGIYVIVTHTTGSYQINNWCIPRTGLCLPFYTVLPWSLIVFSFFNLFVTFGTKFWSWAPLISFCAGTTFDFFVSILTRTYIPYPTYFMWIFIPAVTFLAVRPKMAIRADKLMWFLLFVPCFAFLDFPGISVWGWIDEPVMEILWLLCFSLAFLDK